jgi:uncharacterized Zn finger protein
MNQSLIYRDCPVCDGNTTQPHWQKGELRIVRCGNCGMVYANPVPAEMASGESSALPVKPTPTRQAGE